MRVSVIGESSSAKVLRKYLRSVDAGEFVTVTEVRPDYRIFLEEATEIHEPIVIDSVESEFEQKVMKYVSELTPSAMLVQRQRGKITKENEIRIIVPRTQVELGAVERGVLRALLDIAGHGVRNKNKKRSFKNLFGLLTMVLMLGTLGSSQQVVRTPRVTVTKSSFSVSNFPALQPVSLTQLPAALDGSGFLKVHDQGTVAITGTISCSSGCGGAASFLDNGAFTFGTTSVNNMGAVVDDVATNVVAENSSGAPRMSTNRVLFVDLKNTQANSTAINVAGAFFQVTQPVSIASMPSTPVTGTFWQVTQPVSIATMPSTPVTGTFWQTTQPVSLASAPTTAVTNAGLTNLDVLLSTRTKPADQQHTIIDSSASIAVTGPLTDTQLRATAVPVSGTVTANIAGSISNTGFNSTLLAGSAIAGKFGIDQTTPGTTNGVQVNAALPAGTNVIGHVIVDTAPSTAVTNAGLTNIDVALSTRLKPTDTLAAVTTVGTITNPVTANDVPPTLTKGTQGSTGFSVQALNDAGRNLTTFFTILPIVTTSSEALLSLTGFKSNAAVGTTTTPAVVTSGKTYRITEICISYVAIATAGSTRLSLRQKVGGTVAVTDPVFWQAIIGGPSATAGVGQTQCFYGDIEIAAGNGIGVSQIGLSTTQAAAAVGYGAITITGYEY